MAMIFSNKQDFKPLYIVVGADSFSQHIVVLVFLKKTCQYIRWTAFSAVEQSDQNPRK